MLNTIQRLKNNDPTLTLAKIDWLSDAETARLIEALADNTSLAKLELRFAQMTSAVMLELAASLKEIGSLTSISFQMHDYFDVGDILAAALAEVLKSQITPLSDLNLRTNKIGMLGAIAIADAIPKSRLKILDISNNAISIQGAKALAKALTRNYTLTSLDISANAIGDIGTAYIAEMLKMNETLSILDISDNEITETGAIVLQQALKMNTTLTSLDLGANSIASIGALAIAELLKTNTTLTKLDLNYNDIMPDGLLALAEVVKKTASLTHLDLSRNDMSEIDSEFVAALEVNTSLVSIKFHDSDYHMCFCDIFKVNKNLIELEITYGDECYKFTAKNKDDAQKFVDLLAQEHDDTKFSIAQIRQILNRKSVIKHLSKEDPEILVARFEAFSEKLSSYLSEQVTKLLDPIMLCGLFQNDVISADYETKLNAAIAHNQKIIDDGGIVSDADKFSLLQTLLSFGLPITHSIDQFEFGEMRMKALTILGCAKEDGDVDLETLHQLMLGCIPTIINDHGQVFVIRNIIEKCDILDSEKSVNDNHKQVLSSLLSFCSEVIETTDMVFSSPIELLIRPGAGEEIAGWLDDCIQATITEAFIATAGDISDSSSI